MQNKVEQGFWLRKLFLLFLFLVIDKWRENKRNLNVDQFELRDFRWVCWSTWRSGLAWNIKINPLATQALQNIPFYRALENTWTKQPKKNIFQENPTRKHDKTFMRNSIKNNTIFLQHQRFFYWFDFRGLWFGNLFVRFKEMEGISMNIWVSFIDFFGCIRDLICRGKICL
jgi:hypothetical protein